MSKLRHRSKEARCLEQAAAQLGYESSRTTTGHLKFVHRSSGKIVIAPSKSGKRLERNAYAELKRGAAA